MLYSGQGHVHVLHCDCVYIIYSSVGKGLLCLCRKVYWTSGLLMHCAYAPVTKEEAAKLLK